MRVPGRDLSMGRSEVNQLTWVRASILLLIVCVSAMTVYPTTENVRRVLVQFVFFDLR